MRRRRGSVPVTELLLAGLASVLLVATAGPPQPTARPEAGIELWRGAVVDGDEIETYASLDEMTRAADAVVRGQVVSVAPGRVFGSSPADALHYAAATVRVDELLAGDLPADQSRELTLEIPLFDGREDLAAMQAAAPWNESVFFLRNKGESARAAGRSPADQRAEAGFYRLVIFRGVIVNDAGRATVVPGDGDFLDALSGERFADILERLRAATARAPVALRSECC